ncbi:MAG: hypothetical protein ACRC4U_11165, partial [Shewanella sp.]
DRAANAMNRYSNDEIDISMPSCQQSNAYISFSHEIPTPQYQYAIPTHHPNSVIPVCFLRQA